MISQSACPHCRMPFKLTEKHFGKRLRCPNCQTVFEVGNSPPAAPAQTPDPPLVPSHPPQTHAPIIPPGDPEQSETTYSMVDEPPAPPPSQDRYPSRRKHYDYYDDDDDYDDEDDDDDFIGRRSRSGRVRRRLKPNRGWIILIMGIFSCFMCCIPLVSAGLAGGAIAMSNNDLDKIRRGKMSQEGEGMINVGRTLAYIGIALSIIALIAIVALEVTDTLSEI